MNDTENKKTIEEWMNEIQAMMTPADAQNNKPDIILIRTNFGWMAALKGDFSEMITDRIHNTSESALDEIFGRCKKIKDYR